MAIGITRFIQAKNASCKCYLFTTPYGDMAENYLLEMELREYMTGDASSPVPGHRQLWEAVFVVLKGEGYALVQRDGEAQRRFDWKEGDLYIIEPTEFHSDQAGGRPSARRLQIKPTGYFRDVGIEKYLMQSVPAGWLSSQ